MKLKVKLLFKKNKIKMTHIKNVKNIDLFCKNV